MTLIFSDNNSMQFYIDVKDFKVQPDKLRTMEELIFRTMIFLMDNNDSSSKVRQMGIWYEVQEWFILITRLPAAVV